MRLRELRKKEKLTQEKLAKILNINQKNLSRYESGEVEPNIELLIKIANYFDVSLDYLLDRPRPNKIDITNLTKTQKHIIEMVCQLNEIQANRVEGYTIAKIDEQKEIEKIYGMKKTN